MSPAGDDAAVGPVRRFVEAHWLVLLLLFVAVNLWAAAVVTFEHRSLLAMDDLGLGPLLPWTFYAALGVLLASFALLVRGARPPASLVLVHYGLLVALWHATPALLYGTPRYPFAYKHIGVAGFIQEHGVVDPFIDAYFNWPGFFAFTGFLGELAGLRTPFDFAIWAPVAMNVLILAGLLLLARALTDDTRLVWLTGWVFLLVNWVGQDYFAPQAFAYALHLTIVGLYVAAFTRRGWLRRPVARRPDAWSRLEAGLDVVPGRGDDPDDDPAADDPRRRPVTAGAAGVPLPLPAATRALLLVIMTVLFAAIVASHQLTPFMTLASVAALVLVGLGRARLLVVVMASFVAAWFAYMALPYFAGHLGELVSRVGRLLENVSIASRVLAGSTTGPLSEGRQFVLDMRQGLTLFVAAAAAVGWIRRYRAGLRDWPATVLLLVPVSMVALQTYGGEIIMRIYLFTVPVLAYFAAAAIHSSRLRHERYAAAPLVTFGFTALLAAGMTVAYYGNESMNYVAADELATLEVLYATAPDGAIVVTATDNPPVRHRRYADLDYLHLGQLDVRVGAHGGFESLDELADALLALDRPAVYLLLTRSQAANARLFGVHPGVRWPTVSAQLGSSSRFDPVDGGAAAGLYRLVDPKAAVP